MRRNNILVLVLVLVSLGLVGSASAAPDAKVASKPEIAIKITGNVTPALPTKADIGTAAKALAPASQPVKASPATPEAPAFSTLVQLFKDHKWRPAIAALITLIIFFWRRYLGVLLIKKIPAKHLGWVTAVIGLLAALPANLATEPFVWWKFVLDGFVTGAEAALLWSTVGKLVLPKVFGEVKKAP